MKPQTEIGKALWLGSVLAGAAMAGIPEARTLIALAAKAEIDRAKEAKAEGFNPVSMRGMIDERQQSRLADDIDRAAQAVALARLNEVGRPETKRVRDGGVRGSWPPGTRANRRRGSRP